MRFKRLVLYSFPFLLAIGQLLVSGCTIVSLGVGSKYDNKHFNAIPVDLTRRPITSVQAHELLVTLHDDRVLKGKIHDYVNDGEIQFLNILKEGLVKRQYEIVLFNEEDIKQVSIIKRKSVSTITGYFIGGFIDAAIYALVYTEVNKQ